MNSDEKVPAYSKPQRQWQCSVCFTNFSRMEHLRRHLKSHDNERPYACDLCRRTFTRKDAMKRHKRTCKAQTSSSVPLGASRYNYQEERIQDAVKTFQSTAKDEVETQPLPDIPSPLDFTTLDLLYSQELTPDGIALAGRLEFLAYFTSARGMATFLDQDTLKRRQKMLLEYERQNDTYESEHNEKGRGSFPYILLDPVTKFSATTIDPSMVLIGLDDTDPVLPRTREIMHQFQAIIGTKSYKSIIKLDWNTSVQESCSVLFAPQNIRRFLEYFWSFWYPNCPIVHRPSFNFQTAPIALLCVMVIIGACLSPHDGDAVLARMWLDSVEELVFSNETFQEKPAIGPTPTVLEKQIEWKKKRVECMQMTYLVCSLQKREGSTEAQTRIRRYRHATMVTLARDIGLSASHRSLEEEDPSLSWWREFTIEEELIRLQNSIIFESTFIPVQTGLENWRRIWNARVPEDSYTLEHPQTLWKKIGFVRYAPEFWHLARIIVARIQSESLDEQKSAPRAPVELFRYDHTDMLDVNELIMEYRRPSLSGATLI
ncbi:hypothetical protein BBP40_008037 [Aspergillus hancockii]|nr:hypothetical protein BBP40_008037 [Aspergillus hancockii]